jgi:anti-sigma B factor antagonist
MSEHRTANADHSMGPDLTIAHADACRCALAEVLSKHSGDFTIDLSSVTEFDSSGVQLLLATRRSLAERGHVLRLTAVSSTVKDALAVFGLAALFDQPAAATA